MLYVLCVLSTSVVIFILSSSYVVVFYFSCIIFIILVIYSFSLTVTIIVKLNSLSILINKKSLLIQSLLHETNELTSIQGVCENIVNNNSSYIYTFGDFISLIF